MATIPVLGTRWRCKDSGDVVEVEEVRPPGPHIGKWIVIAHPGPDGAARMWADAHWFTTEGYEHVPA